jgi:hypothetical protein
MQTRLDLPPGQYEVRMAARESGAGRVGAVTYTLDVPDFTKAPLTMSGIVLTSAGAQGLMTARADEQLRQVLPAPATAFREFPQADTLALFAEVYDNAASQPHKVTITTSVLADGGKSVIDSTEERTPAELGGKSGGYGHTARIPLANFAPGLYVLKVTAASTAGKDVSVTREVPFRVVGR